MSDKEIWKDIEGYEGLYQVSNMGRVRSLDRKDAREHRIKGKMLADCRTRCGYRMVGLHQGGNAKCWLIHRLVAMTFIPNPNGYLEINHKNEDKTDNVVPNLEWCTREYNNNYGTHNEHMAKALEQPIYVISGSGLRYFFRSSKKAAELLGLDGRSVSACLHGKQKHCHSFSFEWAV
ncbi:endonuclease [Lacticaseibacillus paracasei]|uniref:NUMOD4 motif-containing HNH endonuclease n=1 Tax=Lacticaseibacillus paracasei TaxID=1597 RepID=UPI0021A75F22|nr:NUMOD4 motif-containing HNH endonuclease [Lacticaseibacillus paracasei]MCT3326802.1 endonuclease [Lacticaseibacillus paracasei]